ncbi:MAG: AMIN domain-containing protein [Leptolyngbyaceae cyanobacterium CSU_1_3]|nr:AMIN domain-containing protein [Leptolyngbyaceae cyanobacterium CSU_1_3]
MFNKKARKNKQPKGIFAGGFYLLPFALCLTSSPAWSAPLRNWQYDPAANQLEVTVKGGVTPRYFLMAQPARIILDLPETEVGDVQTQKTFDGAVRQVRVSQYQPGLTRIVLELSPDTVLAREQAQLKQVGGDKASQRWVLRPLLSQTAIAPSPIPVATQPAIVPSEAPAIAPPPGIAPTEKATNLPAAPKLDRPIDIVVSRPNLPRPTSSLPPTAPVTSTDLPPAIAPTVVAAKPAPVPVPPTPESFPPGILPVEPTPDSTRTEASNQSPPSHQTARPAIALQLPAVRSSLNIPDSLPPVTAPTSTSAPTVSVPPLRRPTSDALPPANVSLPPLAPMPPLEGPTIEFGQPLPISPIAQPPVMGYAPSLSGVILPAGTALSLRYPGTQPLSLQAGQPHQEALILQADLRDPNGNLIASEGTPVLGQFETDSRGSRFVAQTIALPRQGVTIVAQSEPLSGTRKVTENRLLRNSGIGALAGAILGGLSEGSVFGGAAAGAALTYVTSPKPATIAPGQIFQVRLVEDLR